MILSHQNKKIVTGQRVSSANLLLSAACLFWLIAKIIGWKLWVGDRLFPLAPPLEFLQKIPAEIHWILLVASAAFLIATAAKPSIKFFQYGLITVEILSCLLDQNRWHPWEYFYLFILLIFIMNSKDDVIITCLIIALSVVYFYSGIHKMNSAFVAEIWHHTILQRFFHLAPKQDSLLYYAGYLLPVIESVAAVGLLFTKARKTAASILVTMHLFILLLIGPLGINHNQIIWPWNIVLIFYYWFIFIKPNRILPGDYKLLQLQSIIMLTAWATLPLLNFIGLYDNYLSWNLYSSAIPNMTVCIEDSSFNKQLQPFVSKKNNTKVCDAATQINIQWWALKEMNCPAYPELRVYKQIEDSLKARYRLMNATFIIQH